jgi:molybdopterin synthase sulfur carrier subunit
MEGGREPESLDTVMATVFIPSLLRKLAGGKDRATARGATVREIIEDLERQFPGFRDRVIENGDLTGSIAVSVNGEISTEGLHESVPDESEIHFVPAIGGG